MNSKPLTLKELPEAVTTYMEIRERLADLAWSKTFEREAEHNHMNRLMDLMQEQTDYMQKRFWNEVAKAEKIQNEQIIREMMDAKRALVEANSGWAKIDIEKVKVTA
jgi:hypothetical protein